MRMGLLHQMVVDCTRHTKLAQFSGKVCGGRIFGWSLLRVRMERWSEWSARTFTAARLNDEDILASNTLLDLHTGLSALELVEEHLCRRYAEVVADGSVIE